MNIDSTGNAFLVKGKSTSNDSNQIPGSSFEILAKVSDKLIPLYYYVNGSKRSVVDKFYGDALGPDVAEVTGANELTVIFRTKGSAYVSGNYGWITISKFALDTGIEIAKYNFGTKKFDKVNPLDLKNNGPYFNDGNYDPQKPTYTCNYDLKQPSHPLNKPYIDALSTFSNVVNPKSYFLSTLFNGSSTQLINEGASLGISLQTTNIPQKTTLYWRLTGTNITTSDVRGGLRGSATVGSDGKLSFSLNIAEDFKTEGDESLQISFFTDAAFKNQVTTASVTIKDTSTETLFASASTVLPAAYANLTLTGSSDINGTGNSFNNTVTGNNGKNILNGGAGRDRLTGLAGADTFRFTKLTDSLVATYDQVTDFTFGEDKIQGPASYLGKLNSQILNVADLRAATITRALTGTAFKANTASILTRGSQTFIALNDNQAGFQANKDGIVEITGYQGILSVANMASSLL